MDVVERRKILQALLAVPTGALLPTLVGCSPGTYWENDTPTQSVTPEERIYPESAAELVAIIQRAGAENKRVRMTGSGHSYSDVAITEDILLSPNRLNRTLILDRSRLKNPSDPLLARVHSGISIRELNDYLDQQGLALRNMGGYDAQTIVGAAITGTHGSGLHYGPIASDILALQVVGTGGKVVQLEPANGITAREKFPGTIEEDSSIAVELIQDDALFNAVAVSLGCMGVVYAVVLRTDRKYWLQEVRTIKPWSHIKAPDGILDRLINNKNIKENGAQPEYYEIYYNPYLPDRAQDQTCLVTERYKSYDPLKPRNPDDRTRGQFGNNFFTAMAVLFEPTILEFVNKHPKDIPKIIDAALKALRDPSYRNVSYKVFNIGVANEAKVFGIELAFALEQTVAAVERTFQIAKDLQKQGILHNAPISLRFVAPSQSQIAMQYGRRTTMMEIGQLFGARGAERLFWTYQTSFMTEFAARPHWGLDLGIFQDTAWPEYLYPKWSEWLDIYRRMNAQGTFDGRFTDRVGISMHPRADG